MKPEIQRKGEDYYSLKQARAVFTLLQGDDDLPPGYSEGCLHRCENHLLAMLDMRLDPKLMGRAYLAPTLTPDKPMARLLVVDEREKLTWASDVLRFRDFEKLPPDLPDIAQQRVDDWLSVREVTKKWRFHMAPTLKVWQEAIQQGVPMVMDTGLCGDDPCTFASWMKLMPSNSGKAYLFHQQLGQEPVMVEPRNEKGPVTMPPEAAKNFSLVMNQQPDLHKMEAIEAENLGFAYRDVLRQYQTDCRGFEASLHPESKALIQQLDLAARGRVKGE